MPDLYAFTDINHDGEVIPAGTKITRGMLPKEVGQRLIEIGSIVGFDRTATSDSLEMDDDEGEESETESEGENTSSEGEGDSEQ